MRYSVYLQLPLIASSTRSTSHCRTVFVYNHSRIAHIYIYTTDCNPTLVCLKQQCTFAVCFLAGSDYESGEKMKARFPYDASTVRKRFYVFRTVSNDIVLSSLGFSNGSVFGASQICLSPTLIPLPSSFSGEIGEM